MHLICIQTHSYIIFHRQKKSYYDKNFVKVLVKGHQVRHEKHLYYRILSSLKYLHTISYTSVPSHLQLSPAPAYTILDVLKVDGLPFVFLSWCATARGKNGFFTAPNTMLGLVAAPVAVAGFAVAAGNGVVDAEAEVASATGAAADDDDAD